MLVDAALTRPPIPPGRDRVARNSSKLIMIDLPPTKNLIEEAEEGGNVDNTNLRSRVVFKDKDYVFKCV